MNKNLIVRKAHRWIGLFVSLQLLAWTLGGIWFSWNDIDKIHGDHLKINDTNKTISQSLIAPQLALNKLTDYKSLKNLNVIYILEEPIYKIKYNTLNNTQKTTLINAVSNKVIASISKHKAIEIAKNHANFNAEVLSVTLISDTSKHHEYRNKPVPAWAITFDYPSSPTFYVSEQFGVLTSVRHNSWRIFDFLWMLHTMDYEGRDDFGNWLIKIFSLIALITALSGIALFFMSFRRKKK